MLEKECLPEGRCSECWYHGIISDMFRCRERIIQAVQVINQTEIITIA